MENEARLYIRNLSDENAMKLAQILKKQPEGKGAKFEIDHPDPPYILEDEFIEVNNCLGDLYGEVEDCCSDFEGGETKREALADLKKLKKKLARIDKAREKVTQSVSRLEEAAAKL